MKKRWVYEKEEAMKKWVQAVTPPLLYSAAAGWRRARSSRQDLQYVASGWREANAYRGWNAEGVLEAYRAAWPQFLEKSQTTAPFHQIMGASDLALHNILLCFAYSLALAARGKPALSFLDWGGALGQYYLLAQAALPGVVIDYHCKDVPLLAQHGQRLHPEAHFSSDDECLGRSYDFVLASSAVHYSEDWQSVLTALARATNGYLLLTRTPISEAGASFVFSQSAYQSEWLGWSLSREEVLTCAANGGLVLVREFAMSDSVIPIAHAPCPSVQRGFLFQRSEGSS